MYKHQSSNTLEGLLVTKRLRFVSMCDTAGIALILWSAALLIPGFRTVSAATNISGTATLSGAVQASTPFKAARIFAKNLDKNILYLVYTAGGRYRAVDMFPGNYEVTVKKTGFTSEAKKITIKAGANEVLNFSMQAGDPNAGAFTTGLGIAVSPVAIDRLGKEVKLVSMDELYPPGPGRDIVQRTCVVCHGQNFVTVQQWSETQWNAAIDLMVKGPNPTNGAQMDPLSSDDRRNLVSYLTQNFGPGSYKKALKLNTDFPVDEQALSRAMWVEYYLPLDPKLDADKKSRRAQMPYPDNDGNVWFTDRSRPNRIGKLDPRTGEFKDYVLPDPTADGHDLSVDKQGDVWWAENRGFHLGRLNPKTGEMTRYDLGGKFGGLGSVEDSKQNVWFTAIYGNRIGRWDRATAKIKVWEPPTTNSFPYGIAIDKHDNVWIAEFHGCKVAKFESVGEKWTEYPALTQPCSIRRLGVDSKGTVWFGVFSSGKLAKLDPETGKVVEFNIPMPNSAPYDVWPDPQDNIWITDGGQGGAMIKFDPKTEKFTYYPAPQVTDMPKLALAREGIWYCPRSSGNAAVGVFYPDVNRITTLAAYR
jgi:virginiamycin B lyase